MALPMFVWHSDIEYKALVPGNEYCLWAIDVPRGTDLVNVPYSIELVGKSDMAEYNKYSVDFTWYLFPLYENDHIMVGRNPEVSAAEKLTPAGADKAERTAPAAILELYDRRVPKVESVRNTVASFVSIYQQGDTREDTDAAMPDPTAVTETSPHYMGLRDGSDNIVANMRARFALDRINEGVLADPQQIYSVMANQRITLGYTHNAAYRTAGNAARYSARVNAQLAGGIRGLPWNSILALIALLPDDIDDDAYNWNDGHLDNWEQAGNLMRPEMGIMGQPNNLFGSTYAEDLYRRKARTIYRQNGPAKRDLSEESDGGVFLYKPDTLSFRMEMAEMWQRQWTGLPPVLNAGKPT